MFNLACTRRGGIIGVEYQELLHGNGQIRLLDSVQVFVLNNGVLCKVIYAGLEYDWPRIVATSSVLQWRD